MQSVDVRKWLRHAQLPPDFPRDFEGDFLSVPMSGTELLIKLDDCAGTLAFCARLAPLDLSMPQSAWVSVLNYPAEALPAGLILGADDESVYLYGRHYLGRLTDATLERLFTEVLASLAKVREQIEELLADEAPRSAASEPVFGPTPSSGASDSLGTARTENLSDEELLGLLMQSSLRV